MTYPADPFTPEQARALLRHYLNPIRASEADLDRLLKRLGHLPLTLELAGHCFAFHPDLDVDTYLKKFDLIPFYPQFTRWLREIGPVDDAAPMIAFALNWSLVRSKQARWLLAVAAFCAPDHPLPVELLRRALELHLARPWGCLDVLRLKLRLRPRVDLGRALAVLVDLGLLKMRDGGPSIHPLVADFARWHLVNAEDLLPPLAQALNEVAGEAINAGDDALLEALTPHLEAVAESAQEAGLERAGVLWDNLGICYSRAGDLDGARAALTCPAPRSGAGGSGGWLSAKPPSVPIIPSWPVNWSTWAASWRSGEIWRGPNRS